MSIVHFFEEIPSWMAYAGTIAIVLASIYSGALFGRFRKKLRGKDEELPVSTLVGATTALLAFILAFTFGMTASRFDMRRELMLSEVNAIETAYLRAGLVPEPHCSEVRSLLRQYVDIRVEAMRDLNKVTYAIKQSEKLQNMIWSHAEALSQVDLKNPDIVSLFIDSINQLIDLHTKRVTVAVIIRLPAALWITLFALTILSMFEMGYLFGISGKVNWPLVIVLCLAFSSIIMIIEDLDSSTGMIKVNPKPMISLQQRISGK